MLVCCDGLSAENMYKKGFLLGEDGFPSSGTSSINSINHYIKPLAPLRLESFISLLSLPHSVCLVPTTAFLFNISATSFSFSPTQCTKIHPLQYIPRLQSQPSLSLQHHQTRLLFLVGSQVWPMLQVALPQMPRFQPISQTQQLRISRA